MKYLDAKSHITHCLLAKRDFCKGQRAFALAQALFLAHCLTLNAMRKS